MKRVLLVLLLSVYVAACGLFFRDPTVEAVAASADRAYSIPAPDVRAAAVRALGGLGYEIATLKDGEVISSFREYKGRSAGMLFWKKRWLERAQITVTILRSYSGTETYVLSAADVQERPNANYKWYPASWDNERAERQRFLTALDKALGVKNK